MPWNHCDTAETACAYASQIVWLCLWINTTVSLVEQELLSLPEHLSSPPVFSGVRVIRSLVLCVCFVDCCLSFCTFSFGYCVVCSSSIYGFWLPLWYLQTLLILPRARIAYMFCSTWNLTFIVYFRSSPVMGTLLSIDISSRAGN